MLQEYYGVLYDYPSCLTYTVALARTWQAFFGSLFLYRSRVECRTEGQEMGLPVIGRTTENSAYMYKHI